MTAQSSAAAGERLTEGPAPALLRAALDAASEAVLLCDSADDTILMVNTAAQRLVPGLATGASAGDGPLPGLAGALAAGDDSFTDFYAGRHLQGRRRMLGAHHYGWYLRDRTDEVARADALRAERARTAFLA
jgi:hypothetical protein